MSVWTGRSQRGKTPLRVRRGTRMAGFPKHTRRYLVVVTMVAVAAGSLSFASLASAKGGWKWSKGKSLPGSSDSSVIEGLSCPSTSLCLIPANQNGQSDTGIYWSTDPAGGAGAWHFLAVASPFGGDIACDKVGASSYYCDVAGNSLWTSGSPTTSWNAESFANYYDTSTYTSLGAVSCWVNVQCVEADGSGNVFSTDAAAVQSGPLAVFPQLTDYAAPSVGCAPLTQGENPFCAVVEANPSSSGRGGEVAWSTDPSSGTWTTGDTTGGSDLTSIVCPSDALCVALEGGAGESAYIGVSRDPANGAQTWRAVHVPTVGSFGPTLSALTCYSDALCAVSGQNTRENFVYISKNPAAKLSAWSESKLHDGATLSASTSAAGIACPSASECIVVSGEGQVSVGKP
jgi:hypothetical protein